MIYVYIFTWLLIWKIIWSRMTISYDSIPSLHMNQFSYNHMILNVNFHMNLVKKFIRLTWQIFIWLFQLKIILQCLINFIWISFSIVEWFLICIFIWLLTLRIIWYPLTKFIWNCLLNNHMNWYLHCHMFIDKTNHMISGGNIHMSYTCKNHMVAWNRIHMIYDLTNHMIAHVHFHMIIRLWNHMISD